MATPVPICSYGNNSQVAQGVRSQLLPEFDGAFSLSDFSTEYFTSTVL